MSNKKENSIHNLSLETLSPLHIGNGESLSPTGEFLTTSNHIQFLDHESLMIALKENGHFDDYIDKIINDAENFDFYQTLQDWEVKPTVTRNIRLNQTGLITGHNNLLQCCIKTVNQAYIPGSSIKGMLRTAILFKYFDDNPTEWNDLVEGIKDRLLHQNPIRNINKYWTEQEKKIFPHKGANKVVFSAIRPIDSESVEDKDIIVEQVNRQHLYGVDSEGLDWLTECINEEVTIPFKIGIADTFENPDFNYIKSKSMKPLFEAVNAFSLKMINFELLLIQKATSNPAIKAELIQQLEKYKALIQESENQYAVARLGKGKTIFFQTILLLLPEDVRLDLINCLRKDTDTGEFPQTRVLTVTDKKMLGWVRLNWTPPPRRIPNNQVDGELKQGLRLQAEYMGDKKVDIKINDHVYKGIQLNKDKAKRPLAEGDTFEVEIAAISNGIIHQVKRPF